MLHVLWLLSQDFVDLLELIKALFTQFVAFMYLPMSHRASMDSLQRHWLRSNAFLYPFLLKG